MDTLSEAKSERMYSWWWDSHISPKNSRWLQDNLTDLDSNIKWMIKLIEDQDADTFALRAEMYYKKRPELMKVVEEFYRAYRALAERYDHATGALRQAHRTMSKVCPNQFPSVLPDDSPANSFSEADPRTPEMSTPGRAFFDFDAAKKNGTFTEESNSKKGLKFAEGRVRKGLNFHEAVESEQVDKYEKEILVLKETLAKLEAEKEAVGTQYQQSLKSLSKLEAEVSRAQEDSRELREEARRAEAESQALKENLSSLEAEKEASLLQYQLCLEKISKLEDILSDAEKDCRDLDERANKAETEAQILKQDLAKIEDEKDSVFNQYKQSSEMISDLENKLLLAENSAQKYSERAEMAEGEVETLKLAISKLNEEKETMVLKMGSQSQEITEKQKELGRLWASIQEEWLRFMEAETAFPTLQLLHSRAQDELRSLASELQNKGQLLRDVEIHNGSLYDEILKLKEENKSVNELNFSSTISMKGMQNEIFSLRETNWKLEEENAHLENSLSQSAIALEITQQRLKDLEKTFAELEEKYSALEKEKKFTITEVEEVKVYLEEQKQEHVNLAQTSAIYLAGLETQVHFLQEENWKKNREFEGEFDKSMEAKMEIFVLKRCIQDLGEKHSCLMVEFQKLLYKSRMSEKLISELEQANVEKQLEVKSLFHLGKEKEFLGEVCRSLEIELRHLHDNYIMIKNREKCLSSKMQRKNDEIAMWETRGTIAQTLFEEKVVELLEKCKSLQDGNSSKDVKIDLLVKKIGVLEGENEKLKAQLIPYGPAVTSLMDSISSLEKHALSQTNLQNSSSEEVKEAELGNYEPVTNHPSAYQNAMVSDAFADMHNLQARVKVIENSLIEMKRLRGNVKPASEISEVGPKDIMLDHMSEHSSYGICRRYYVGPDNQMLELWETTEQDSSIDLTVGKGKQRPEAIKHKSGYYYSDFLTEKELGVDDLEISKKFAEARHEGNKRKVLERLNSDVQKLTNLQITVQDLKRKVEIMDKGRKGKAIIESENMKWKLEEAEVAIGKLFDQNGKVMKNVEDNYGKKPTIGSEESGSVRRRRISEQARRVSEKIGRLQLEIQRVQFDLVKLRDENENKGKIRVTETKRRVLLRDFIYGGRPRKNPRPTRKKKTPFCACMEPPTRGD